MATCMACRIQAQTQPLASLPTGRYQTWVTQGTARWDKGDLLLVDEKRYCITGAADTGMYRASFTAQRIFFVSGPLRGANARLAWYHNQPAIEWPLFENNQHQLANSSIRAIYLQ